MFLYPTSLLLMNIHKLKEQLMSMLKKTTTLKYILQYIFYAGFG